MNPVETSKTENLQTDIVVIGEGGADLAAVVVAAEKGANNIILLETRRSPGDGRKIQQKGSGGVLSS